MDRWKNIIMAIMEHITFMHKQMKGLKVSSLAVVKLVCIANLNTKVYFKNSGQKKKLNNTLIYLVQESRVVSAVCLCLSIVGCVLDYSQQQQSKPSPCVSMVFRFLFL